MRQPASFEQQVDGQTFTFVRVCSDEQTCDEYSVMGEGAIMRMSREEGAEDYTITHTENVPDSIVSIQDKLSSCIRKYEDDETSSQMPLD